MSADWQDDVRKFHKRAGLEVALQPTLPNYQTQQLRKQLVEEEHTELQAALTSSNLAEIADASADLIYVVLGTLVSYGIELRPIWNEVQHCNMLKVPGPKRADGKQLKPEGWQHPNIQKLIDEQISGEYRLRCDRDFVSKLP